MPRWAARTGTDRRRSVGAEFSYLNLNWISYDAKVEQGIEGTLRRDRPAARRSGLFADLGLMLEITACSNAADRQRKMADAGSRADMVEG
jgi:hypothetical protein